MSGEPIEILLLFQPDGAEAALAEARRQAVLVGLAPPRLAIARVAPEGVAALARIPGVAGAFSGAPPEAVLQGLDPAGRIFAEAWALRRTETKRRPGDGLSWDAPGFQPPDKPPP